MAYKKYLLSRREALKKILAMENKEEFKDNVGSNYKDKIETELQEVCEDVVDLVDTHLLKNSQDAEAIVFF